MNLPAMLLAYRANANPQMTAIAAEFHQLSASEQRELLFWMLVDTATNPTHLRKAPQHG